MDVVHEHANGVGTLKVRRGSRPCDATHRGEQEDDDQGARASVPEHAVNLSRSVDQGHDLSHTGCMSESMAWITPLEARRLVFTICVSFTLYEPCRTVIVSLRPSIAVAVVGTRSRGALTVDATMW